MNVMLLIRFFFSFSFSFGGLIFISFICFRCMQLEDGDIVCFQKPTPVENCGRFRHPNVASFLDSVCNHHSSSKPFKTFSIRIGNCCPFLAALFALVAV